MTDKLYFGAAPAARLNPQPNIFMRIHRQKTILSVLLLGTALVCWSYRAAAQLSVGSTGLAPQTFDTLPLATSWSQRSTPGGAGDITTTAAMDAQVQTNSASLIVAPLASLTGNPPGASANGIWASEGRYILTRVTGNRFTTIMATLRNNTGSNLSSIRISYDLNVRLPVTEQIPGNTVYFSLTGTAGTWQRLDAISGIATSGNLSTNLTLGSWAQNANLYVLFTDDNGSGTPDTSVEIDNFAVTVPFPGITNQPQSSSVAPGQAVVLSVGAVGYQPLFYQWRKNGGNIANATNATLTILNAQESDNGTYSVIVSNSFGTVFSSNAALVVSCTTPASFTAAPANQNLALGATINLVSSASGSSPITYQWSRNGNPIAGATNPTYTKLNATLSDAGLYTVTIDNCTQLPTSASAVVAITEAPYVLMGLTNQFWRYNQTGTDLGTAWVATNYNDSAWPQGRGLLAVENNAALVPLINTTLALNPGSGQIPTYYFRTTFVLTNDPSLINIIASNYVDDGAVVYLNGQEVYRINMPEGTINYNTLAPGTLTEGVYVLTNLPSSLLRLGTNHLAVEVHQVNLTSSDVAFGLALHVNFLTPTLLSITNQPQSLVLDETRTANFTVGVEGQPAYYQWYKNGAPLVGATRNPLSLTAITTNDAGSYFAVATNSINSVTSSVATLTVLADTNGPVLVSADGTISNNLVVVSFNELVLQSTATNVANYRITNTLGGLLTISSAVLQNGTNVLLTTSASRLVNNNYILIVSNVRDTSPRTNSIIANSAIPISTLVNIIAMNNVWRFYDPFPPFDEPNLGTAWKEFTYNEAPNFWADGTAAFYNGPDPADVPVAANTALSQTETITSYFRTPFNIQASPGRLQLLLTHVVDDGAVFWLNGNESLRANMPTTAINYLTPASGVVGNISRVGPITIDTAAFRSGSNVLAVELHQFQSIDTDKAFAAQLDAKVESFTVGPVIITGGPRDVTVFEGQPATFEVVQVGGLRFQWQSNNVPVTGATNAFYTIERVTTNMHGSLFRVAVSNATSFAISTNATLRVINDTNPPAIVSAFFQTTTSILVSFSEFMNQATAQTPGNYVVTNSTGGAASLTSAVLVNGTNVLLTFSNPLSGSVVVVVNNLRDASTAGNLIAPNSAVTVGFDLTIPLTSAWKYLLVNTNEEIQTSFASPVFDDSSWRGPSNALLYVEGAALPAPKNTPLSLFADGGNTERINTFYFRQSFVSPVSVSNFTVRLRHVIDDGLILHLNGAEIFRFAMPAGAVTAASQATAAIGDATVLGPVDIVISLQAGTNVLAAEVHQNGTASSDIVFGLEIIGSSPSTVIKSPAVVQIAEQPRSRTNSVGSSAFFRVSATGSGPLYYQWLKAGVNIPGATNPILALANVQPSDAVNYSARVTNSFSSVTSSNALLTVTGSSCTYLVTTNRILYSRAGTNLTLSWINPVTNTAPCNSVGVLQLQGAYYLSNSPSTIVWSNLSQTSPYVVGVPTNNVPVLGGARYYRLVLLP
jgi:hypothetical protein